MSQIPEYSEYSENDVNDVLIISCIIPNEDNEDNRKKVLYKKFLELAYNDKDNDKDNDKKESRIVSVSEFIGEYICLELGNGGSWCRMDSTFSKKYKYVLRKSNGNLTYSWNITEIDELKQIKEDFIHLKSKKGNKISHIKVYGLKENLINTTREIRSDIRNHFKNSICVVCGNSDIEIDHKNGLYNDKRVLDIKTQKIEDFQPLCRHCNQQKRQSIIVTKETKKRYKATLIPQLKPFNIDFTKGDEIYKEDDINAMEGTYWYDPISFMNFIKSKIFNV